MSNIKLHEHSTLPGNIHINVVRHVQRVTSKKDFVVLRADVLPFSRFEVQDVVDKQRGCIKRKREDTEDDDDCLDTPEGSESSSTQQRQQPTPPFMMMASADKKLDDENSLWNALELELLFGNDDRNDNTQHPATLWVLEDDNDEKKKKERVCAAQ